MATTQKAIDLLKDVAAELKLRRPALAQVLGFDADGNPTLREGGGSAGNDGFFLRIKPVDTIQKDVLGLTQQVFTPHVAQLAFEANFAGTTDNVADVQVWATKLAVLGALIARGVKVEVYESANGTFPVVGSLVAANLKASFEISEKYRMLASI